ncbi:MAG: hypothetical protein ACI8VT_002230, partial [Saprospiraceae bacterium]
ARKWIEKKASEKLSIKNEELRMNS